MSEEVEEKKAYDLKKLVDKLKEDGLDVAEDAAKLVLEKTLEWVKESADESDSIVDDILVKFIPTLKDYIMDEIDKIDGEDDDGDGVPASS
jgi:hypothetical protein